MPRPIHPMPRRLIAVSEQQTPDPACLTLLRRLHPAFEMVCLSPGVWWIGEVRPTSAAVLHGQARLAMLRHKLRHGGAVRALSFWKAELMAQGFRTLGMVTAPQPTPSQCYAAIAPALRATERSVDRALDAAIADADGSTKRAASTKWLREEYAPQMGRDAFRHAFHRPLFSIPGATP